MPDSAGSQRFWWLPPVRRKVPMKEADRQAGQALCSLLKEADRSEVEALVARGQRVHAVRRICELTGLRIIDSRRIFESLKSAYQQS